MKFKTVLFDLDGTLLPMDQDIFVKSYFKLLAAKLAPLGYNPEKLIQAVWAGTDAMVKNDGTVLNEEAFWNFFCGIFGEKALDDKPVFEEFYKNEFQKVQSVCGYNPMANEIVQSLKAAGVQVALATNPLFPAIATQSRISWAGLKPDDFAYYTTYENSSHCKPNLEYYKDVLNAIGADPKDCLMVGNDVGEDMVSRQLGMEVFLLTDCLINKAEESLDQYPHGDFAALKVFLNLY